ncbi:MAG: helical backbone metal receptor [Gammaproteobacteria bacterium]
MRTRRFAALLLLLLSAACDSEVEPADAARVAADQDELRIVSLAPHLTELVYSAGAAEFLVGVVEHSDYPAQAQALPRVGDAFAIDFERLAVSAPTVVLAWEGGNPVSLIEAIRARGYRVEALATGSLDDVAANLRDIGRLTGTSAQANAAAAQFENDIAALALEFTAAPALRVFFQIAEQPVYTIGGRHAISQVLSTCGASNVFADLKSLAAVVTDEAVVSADADVMMTTGDVTALARWARFNGRAQRANTLYGISADTITRDSLRVLDGAREVCHALDDARRKLRDLPR